MSQQLELEIGGIELVAESFDSGRFRYLCRLALASAGIAGGHLAVEFVSPERIQVLNREYRNLDKPTDVLSFPVDSTAPVAGPRELGDVVVCPQHCDNLIETSLHGVLHLLGLDHETDNGQMLALQRELVSW